MSAGKVGFGITILGVLLVTVSTLIQFYNLDHGSSNQITIDAEMNTNVTLVMTGISFFIVGYLFWIFSTEIANKYMAVFLLAFMSFLLSNIAILFSLYQVNVIKTS
jgi:hypothetical protein